MARKDEFGNKFSKKTKLREKKDFNTYSQKHIRLLETLKEKNSTIQNSTTQNNIKRKKTKKK